ncbi:MAG: archease [Nanoarchaeota archaeon]|nr:archease [Nanoarchaeota archaeon]MBU1854994.1 archease [Nanoarchaeota archaeon]
MINVRYEYLEDVATADIAFKAQGDNMNELFENAAFALSETMVETENLKEVIVKNINLEETDLEQLLFLFLSEIVYLKDVDLLFFSRFEVKIDGCKLAAKIYGEKLNGNMNLKTDIKAITMHMLKIFKKDKYYATVVLDV